MLSLALDWQDDRDTINCSFLGHEDRLASENHILATIVTYIFSSVKSKTKLTVRCG